MKSLISIVISGLLLLGLFKLDSRINRSTFSVAEPLGCSVQNLSGLIEESNNFAFSEGQKIEVPLIAFSYDEPETVLGLSNAERWVEVDLSEQKLYAWEGDSLFLETKISSGLPQTPTPTGEFRVWIKLRATKMEGGQGRYYYYLPNVPYTMFFHNNALPKSRGYGLHGTYWHNDFGIQRSHGCVNLPTPIAKELFYWIGPVLSEGKSVVYADAINLGTRIVIHE